MASSVAHGCAWVCLGLSASAVCLLSVWGVLLVTHSMSFPEVPVADKTRGGIVCFVVAGMYFLTGAISLILILMNRKDLSAHGTSLQHKYTPMSDLGRGEEDDGIDCQLSRGPSTQPFAPNRHSGSGVLSRRSPRGTASPATPQSGRTMAGGGDDKNKPTARVKGKRSTSPPPDLLSDPDITPPGQSLPQVDLMSAPIQSDIHLTSEAKT